MLTRIKQFFKSCFKKVKTKGIWWALYFTFTWVIPLVLINEKYVFYDNGAHEIKFTAIGITVGVVLLFCFRKFLWRKVTAMKPSSLKWGLLTLNRAIPYGILVALCYMIINHTDTIISLLWKIGVSLIIGVIFEFIYIFQQKVALTEMTNAVIDARIQEGENNGGTNEQTTE